MRARRFREVRKYYIFDIIHGYSKEQIMNNFKKVNGNYHRRQRHFAYVYLKPKAPYKKNKRKGRR